MYLQTSRDILNIALSASVVVVAAAVTWLLIEFIQIFRDIRVILFQAQKMIKEVHEAVARVESAITDAGEKVVQSVTSFRSIIEGVMTLVSYVKEKKSWRKRKSGAPEM